MQEKQRYKIKIWLRPQQLTTNQIPPPFLKGASPSASLCFSIKGHGGKTGIGGVWHFLHGAQQPIKESGEGVASLRGALAELAEAQNGSEQVGDAPRPLRHPVRHLLELRGEDRRV